MTYTSVFNEEDKLVLQTKEKMEEEKSVTQEEKTFQKKDNTFHQGPNKNSFGSSTRSNSSYGDKK